MQQHDNKSWFKQFWPWFLIALPLTAVVASIYTVKIAFTNKDALVKSEYYKDGLAINEQLKAQQAANELELSGSIRFEASGKILLSLTSKAATSLADTLTLSLIHPVSDKADFQIALVKTAANEYQGSLNRPLDNRWYLQITPFTTLQQPEWKLQSTIDFTSSNNSQFNSTP